MDVCEPQETKHPTGETFRYIDIDAIDNKSHCVSEPKTMPTAKAPSRAAKGLRSGDTLFSMVRPYLENIAFVSENLCDCIASTGFYICRPREEVVFPLYMYYFLTSSHAIDGINSYMRGDNSPAIRKDEMDSFFLPVPPLQEQMKIVEVLAKTLALINELESNRLSLTDIVTAAKSKILSLAISGKLVPQDPADEPASVLLERIREERSALVKVSKIKCSKGDAAVIKSDDNSYYENVPHGWALARLDMVSDIIMGQSPSGDSVTNNVNGIEFHQGKIFFTDRYLNCSEQYTNEGNKFALKDSVLLCVRAPVGVINITDRKIAIGRGLCAVSPCGSISVEFIFHWLTAFQTAFIEQATGTTFMSITTDVVRKQIVPIPPLAEQRRIVETIDRGLKMLNEIALNLS